VHRKLLHQPTQTSQLWYLGSLQTTRQSRDNFVWSLDSSVEKTLNEQCKAISGKMSGSVLEFEPPLAAVGRVIKTVLPNNVMLTKDARAALSRAAGIFIFYLTHCANDFSRESKRSTIFAQDIKHALRELDFEDFEAPLEEFLELYRKAQKDAAEGKLVTKTLAATGGDEGEGEGDGEGEDDAEAEADMQLDADNDADFPDEEDDDGAEGGGEEEEDEVAEEED